MRQDAFDKILTSLKDNVSDTLCFKITELTLPQIAQLAEAIKITTSLTSLSFEVALIGDEAGKLIGEALKINTSLKKLCLNFCGLRDGAGRAIAEALKVNRFLKILYLDGNHLSNETGKVIGEALKINTSLTILSLGYNQLSNDTEIAIGEAIKVNTSLNELHLYGNWWLQDEVGEAIARALKMNTTLTKINFSGNQIHDKVVCKVNSQAKINTEITKILMVAPFLNHSTINQLRSLLAKKQGESTAIYLPVPSLKELALASFYKSATENEEEKLSCDEKAQTITFKNKRTCLPKELFDPSTQALNFKEQNKSWLTLSIFADSKSDKGTSKQDQVQTWEIKNKFI